MALFDLHLEICIVVDCSVCVYVLFVPHRETMLTNNRMNQKKKLHQHENFANRCKTHWILNTEALLSTSKATRIDIAVKKLRREYVNSSRFRNIACLTTHC